MNGDSDDDLTGRLREICMALPEVTERPSHGTPSWFVRDKKSFVQLWANGHHDDDFPHLWCAGLPGAQEALSRGRPCSSGTRGDCRCGFRRCSRRGGFMSAGDYAAQAAHEVVGLRPDLPDADPGPAEVADAPFAGFAIYEVYSARDVKKVRLTDNALELWPGVRSAFLVSHCGW